MSSQRALRRDEFITPELTNHLFQTEAFPFGLDLAAINIQRGRDHGIASYTSWRHPCGLSPIQNWDDLSKVVGVESARRISFAYKSVHDIDLFVGGISEKPVVGGIVGPTFACIIAQQFSNLRKGDRFWYENPNLPNSFTLAQLNSLRRVTFSQVLCRSIGGGTLQPHIFLPHQKKGKRNERVLCGLGPLAPIDLRPWLDSNFLENKENTPTFNNLTFTTASISPLLDFSNNKQQKNISIDVIPNGVIGLQMPDKNQNNINEKLDFHNKILSEGLLTISNVSKNATRQQRSVQYTSTFKPQTKHLTKNFEFPHEVTINAPGTDQYEVEISIKPINKGSQQQNRFENYQSQNYESFTNNNKEYIYKKPKSTQPPTIIYLDDQSDTTKTPGILQNIFNFAQRTTTKLPNKLDTIQSYFLSPPEISFNKPTQNYNSHSDSNSVFSFTIRPNNKPSSYYNTLPRPETLSNPQYNDHSPIKFGHSSMRPIFSPQQTYNYYYFNRGPFYTNRPENDYPFLQKNENLNDIGRSELVIADENDEMEITTINNDYDYYDYNIKLNNESLDEDMDDKNKLSLTERTILQDQNISVNDNYVLPVINITRNIDITSMPKNFETNIYSHDYLNVEIPVFKEAQNKHNIIDAR